MFDNTDPRSYIIPITRTLEHLQNIDTAPLSQENSTDTINAVKDALHTHFDSVETNANLTQTDRKPDNKYLTQNHIPTDKPQAWVEYTATYGTKNTNFGDRHLMKIEVIYTEPGRLFVDTSFRPRHGTFSSYPYRGPLDNFSATSATLGALRAVRKHTTTMVEDGLSATEIIDFLHTDFYSTHMENWANTRNVTYEGVRTTRESARTKLQDAHWPAELTKKQQPEIQDTYQTVLNKHNDLLDTLVETLLPDEIDTPDSRAVLKVTLIETFAVPIHFDDTEIPDYDLFIHKLGEMPMNADNFTANIRLLTDHDGMDINTFTAQAHDLFDPLNDAYDPDTKLDELAH